VYANVDLLCSGALAIVEDTLALVAAEVREACATFTHQKEDCVQQEDKTSSEGAVPYADFPSWMR
jgi:hypothetical protein